MMIQDSFVATVLYECIQQELGDKAIHDQIALYLTDLYFGNGSLGEPEHDSLVELEDYITDNRIRVNMKFADMDEKHPDDFQITMIVSIGETVNTFDVTLKIRSSFKSIFSAAEQT